MEKPSKYKKKQAPSSRRKSNFLRENEFQPKIRSSQYYIKENDMRIILLQGKSIPIPLKTDSDNLEEIKGLCGNLLTKYEQDDDIYCDVCLNKSYSEDDLIVICDLCEAAVHQHCYGGELINGVPTDQWFCQRCDQIIKKKINFYSIKCSFCPEIKGIMKEINGFLWGHLSCVKWISELGKFEKNHLQPFVYNLERHSLVCTLCDIKYGACIQCDYGLESGCSCAFHVSCAQRHGIIPTWNSIVKTNLDQDQQGYIPIFCYTHQNNYQRAITDELHSINKSFERNPLNYSCICKGFYDPLKDFYLKNKSQGQNTKPNGQIVAESKKNLKKNTKNTIKNAKTLEISSEENYFNKLNGSNGSSETNKEIYLKRKEISLEDNKLRKQIKEDTAISRKNTALKIMEEDIESFDSSETKKSEEFKSIHSKRKKSAFEEVNNKQKSLSKEKMQMEISDEENQFSVEKKKKNGFSEEKKKEIVTNFSQPKEEKTLKKMNKTTKASSSKPSFENSILNKSINLISITNSEEKNENSFANKSNNLIFNTILEKKNENSTHENDLKDLFDFKPSAPKKNSLGVLSSLNLLVSGGQNKPIKDELVLKKWLHNWVYTLDRSYRLDLISVSKQQHVEFEELFTGRKIKF